MIETLAARFHALFAGLERAHGIYFKLDSAREDGKLTCSRKPDTLVDPVTDALWIEHLSGRNGLGIVPIREDSTVRFGGVDIDVYDGLDHAQIAGRLVELNLPMIPFLSKSGGCHIYLFVAVPVPAELMQAKLRDIAAMIGFDTAEIFPKQITLAENDFGSWLNMPYYGGEDTTRYAVRPDGERLTMEQFLETAGRIAVGPEFFKPVSAKAAREKDTFPDGPPCLNMLARLGFPAGTSNTSLYNIGVYYKKSMLTGGWEDAVKTANDRLLSNPRSYQELTDTVKSVGKKDYNYQCKQEPLMSHCNRAKCQLRTFGVSGGSSSFPVLEELRKLDIDPPVYFWDVIVDGVPLTLELTDAQVQDPREFKKRIWQKAGLQIPLIKKELWDSYLNALRKDDKLKVIDVPEEASAEGLAWNSLNSSVLGTNATTATKFVID